MEALEIKLTNSEDEYVEALRIRVKVFQQLQKVPTELDFDGLDAHALHFLVYYENKPVGTARIRYVENGLTAKIERMAILPCFQKRYIGTALLGFIFAYLETRGIKRVQLHAQEYAQKFYEAAGFLQKGKPFIEADFAHIKMELKLPYEFD